MKNYLVTIETYYSIEEFLIPMNTEKSEVLQIDNALADICFCDDYAIVKWEEVQSEYMTEREKLVKLWEEENNESIEFRAISGKYATLESLKFELMDREERAKILFSELYENEWDYVNKNFEKGFLYIQFLKEKNLIEEFAEMKECWQIDFSKIPSEYVEHYKNYIKNYMIKNLDYSMENFEKEFTLESVIEEFKNGMKI